MMSSVREENQQKYDLLNGISFFYEKRIHTAEE